MPNVHALDKRQLSVWVPMDVYAKFASLAKLNGVPMSEMLVRVMRDAAANVPLTEAQELEWRRRMSDRTVTVADVLQAAAQEALITAADAALGLTEPPSLSRTIRPRERMGHKPLPKRGSRKKKDLS